MKFWPPPSPRDRVKCDGFLGAIPYPQGRIYVQSKPPTMPSSVLQVCGGREGGG